MAAFDQLPKIPRMVDVRLALKRWTAVFLTWYGGQKLLLEAAVALLDNNNNKAFQWEGVQRVFALDQHQHHNKKES